MSQPPEFAQVLISRREIESLDRIAAIVAATPGGTLDWAVLVTITDSAKRALSEAESQAIRLEQACASQA